jgi:hypothetical protein
MALGDKYLVPSGDDRLDRAQRLTSPGMVTWADLDNVRYCTACAHFWRRHCQLYLNVMRPRLRDPNFMGPKLPRGQRACTQFAPHGERGGPFPLATARGDTDMVSFSDRYPPGQGGTFLKADHLRGQDDLIGVIESVDLDVQIGGKLLDIVRFQDSEYSLVLSQATGRVIVSLYGDDTDDWIGNAIALFCDDTVEFKDKDGVDHRGGVRVRPAKPGTMGDGSAATVVKTTTATTKPPFDDDGDSIPF